MNLLDGVSTHVFEHVCGCMCMYSWMLSCIVCVCVGGVDVPLLGAVLATTGFKHGPCSQNADTSSKYLCIQINKDLCTQVINTWEILTQVIKFELPTMMGVIETEESPEKFLHESVGDRMESCT